MTRVIVHCISRSFAGLFLLATRAAARGQPFDWLRRSLFRSSSLSAFLHAIVRARLRCSSEMWRMVRCGAVMILIKKGC